MPNFDLSVNSGYVRVELVEGGTSIADLVVRDVAFTAIMYEDSSGRLTAHVSSVRTTAVWVVEAVLVCGVAVVPWEELW